MASLISQFIWQIDNKFHKIFTQESRASTSDGRNGQATSPLNKAYSIAHALPGRVRFHVPWISHNSFYVERLKALLKAEQWITSERINPNAASIVITYEYEMISDSKMRSRLANLIESAASMTTVTKNPVAKSTQPEPFVNENVQPSKPFVAITEETPKATDAPETLTQPVPQQLANSFVSSQSPPQQTSHIDLSPVQQDVISSKSEPQTIPATNSVDSRVFLFEVAGLHQSKETDKMHWSIRHSGSVFMKVPFNRMNQQMQWINRLGGKIVSIQPA